jgi:hypothetical protein
MADFVSNMRPIDGNDIGILSQSGQYDDDGEDVKYEHTEGLVALLTHEVDLPVIDAPAE